MLSISTLFRGHYLGAMVESTPSRDRIVYPVQCAIVQRKQVSYCAARCGVALAELAFLDLLVEADPRHPRRAVVPMLQ